MIVTIHQPEHIPWLGLINKISKAELFVVLDSVQFEKNYFQNRNRILGTNGVQWIGIPVKTKGHMDKTISKTEISNIDPKWREKYLKTVLMCYGKYPFFGDVFPLIEKSIETDTNLFCEINLVFIRELLKKLALNCEIVRSTDLSLSGLKSDLILDICKKTKADIYIAGPSGRDYLNISEFGDAGITVKYNDYSHPVYEQRRSEEFISHLSCIDLFMNVGFEKGKEIIMAGNEGLSDR